MYDPFVAAYLISALKLREQEDKGGLEDMELDEIHDLIVDCVDAKLKAMQDARKQLTSSTVRTPTQSINQPVTSSYHHLKGKIIKMDGKIVSIDGKRV